MTDTLDPAWIIGRLRQLLADCERDMQPHWHMQVQVTAIWHPRDGSGGTATFTVSTERPDDDDDTR